MPVEHVAGAEAAPPRRSAEPNALRRPRDCRPHSRCQAYPPITDVGFDSPVDARGRLVAWVIEREAIRLRRGRRPTAAVDRRADPSRGRFCNVYREHDRVTLWITGNTVGRTVTIPIYGSRSRRPRCINEPEALAELLPHLLPFDAARASRS